MSDFNYSRSTKIHWLITQMTAADKQPFSIVNNEGYRALALNRDTSCHFSHITVTEMCHTLKTKVIAVIGDA